MQEATGEKPQKDPSKQCPTPQGPTAPSQQLCQSQRAPHRSPAGPGATQRHHPGKLWGSQARLGSLSQWEGREGGGAEFQSPRNLVPGNPGSAQETHPCRASLRHKGEKEGVGHSAGAPTPAPVSLSCFRGESEDGGGKHTHASFYIAYLTWSLIHKHMSILYIKKKRMHQ